MSDTAPPAWLADLQRRFGEALRTPLDRASGSLRARTNLYDPHLCTELTDGPRTSARERLAVYHRQYWFRLFTALQTEYRLTARLTGMWWFNELAARYLTAHPPRTHDLQDIGRLFASFLAHEFLASPHFASVPSAALIEAAHLDRTFSRVFLAPEVRLLRPARLAEGDFAARRLVLAPTVALLVEHWPLMDLRRMALDDHGEGAIALPARLEQPRHWAVFRTDTGQGLAALEPLTHRLFTLLSNASVGEALATLEAGCDAVERQTLPSRVQRWLRESMRAGFWLDDDG